MLPMHEPALKDMDMLLDLSVEIIFCTGPTEEQSNIFQIRKSKWVSSSNHQS